MALGNRQRKRVPNRLIWCVPGSRVDLLAPLRHACSRGWQNRTLAPSRLSFDTRCGRVGGRALRGLGAWGRLAGPAGAQLSRPYLLADARELLLNQGTGSPWDLSRIDWPVERRH